MGDHSRLLPTGLVLLLIFSVLLPFSQPQIAPELESESTLELVSTKSGGLIDVANWRIGDEWVYDSEFDVEELIQGGAAGSQAGHCDRTATRVLEAAYSTDAQAWVAEAKW